MKKLKRLIAITLAFAIMSCMSTSVFAAETVNRLDSKKIEKHTIEVVAKPGLNTFSISPEQGVAPAMWNQNTYTVKYGGKFYTATFSVPDRYFAYEVNVTGAGSGTCVVNFLYDSTSGLAGLTCFVNGGSKKADWITIPSVGEKNYMFQMINGATSDIQVTITCYSWA